LTIGAVQSVRATSVPPPGRVGDVPVTDEPGSADPDVADRVASVVGRVVESTPVEAPPDATCDTPKTVPSSSVGSADDDPGRSVERVERSSCGGKAAVTGSVLEGSG